MDLLTHLRCFVTVAEERHFGRAAGRLHLTQPALSRTIARLERTLGARLFDRTSRPVRLSSVGELLFPEAERVVSDADRFVALAEQAARGEIGTIRAGLPLGLPAPTVATLTRTFRERHAAVGLELREQPPGTELTAGLDIALLVPDEDGANLHRGPVVEQVLGVVLSGSGTLASRAEIHLADLGGRALAVLPMDQSAWEPQLLAACRAGGFEPTMVHRPQQPEFALGLVLADDAVALADADSAGPGLIWIPVVGQPIRRRLQPVWRADEPGVQAFAEIAVDALCEGGAWRRADRVPDRRGPVPRPGSFA